jgi:hypothetical protein
MQFQEFRDDVLSQMSMVGAAKPSAAENHPKHLDAVVAAAACVIEDKGADWALDNPRAFKAAVYGHLTFWWKAAFWVASILVPGAAIWLTILEYAIPYIYNWLSENSNAGLVGADNLAGLSVDATEFIKSRFQ